MSGIFGRFTRALIIAGVIAGAIALPAFVGIPFMPQNDGSSGRVALAAPALQDDDDDGGDGNDDPTNDNSDERNIEGQVIELWEGRYASRGLPCHAWRERVGARRHGRRRRLGAHLQQPDP